MFPDGFIDRDKQANQSVIPAKAIYKVGKGSRDQDKDCSKDHVAFELVHVRLPRGGKIGCIFSICKY